MIATPASAFPESATPTPAAQAIYGRRERVALTVGALLMFGIVAASALIARRTAADLSDAARAQTARSLTAELTETVLSAETGQRGYLLTGRPSYRAPYDKAAAEVPGLLDRLEAMLRGDARLPGLRALVQDKMAELQATVRLEQAGRHADALATVLTNVGRDDMVGIRAITDSLSATQARTADAELARSQDGTRLLVWVDAIALAQLLLLAGFVGSSIRQTIHALHSSGTALQAANAELQAGRDRLEAAVAERTADLTDANEEIQRFAYIVSHDLRAPLLNIIGFTSELEHATTRLNRFVSENLEPAGIVVPQEVRAASQEDLPEAIRFIQTSTAKMDRLITAILRLSREGRRVLAPELLDMKALLGGVFDSVRHQAEMAGADLVLDRTPNLICDRIAVEQVFSNLVENALKYRAAARSPRIEISGERQGAMARYAVRDNGRGIAQRDRDRIFELFRRAGPQDTTGEGIGLAHVRTLLRRLGGTVECESVLDSGSTFIIHLPAALAPEDASMIRSGGEAG